MLRLLGRRLEIRRNSCSGFSFGTILTGEFLRLARESPKPKLLRRVHRLVFCARIDACRHGRANVTLSARR